MCPAAAPAAFSPCASVAPAASAAAFLAAPASSTPTGSLDCSQTTPARVNTCASEPRELLVAGGGDERRRRACTISCACAGPPTQATRAAPKLALSTTVGGRPSGGDEPLGDRHDGGARAEAGRAERGDHLAEAARGHREEHVVGALDARRGRLDAQLRGQLDARQVDAVLALARRASPPARRVRVCSVVRRPPRASSTASAVPNEPAPMTVARRAPGVGSERARGARAAGLAVGSGSVI